MDSWNQGYSLELVQSLPWIKEQCVRINNTLSNMVSVFSGVPQVSILDSLLFVAFINDLPSCITLAPSFLFADDTKCLKIISNPSDILSIQNALNKALSWSDINDLSFNQSKFLHIHFGKDFGSHNFTINGMTITRTDYIKDLGVNISSSLKNP